jgi:hypothetical protein
LRTLSGCGCGIYAAGEPEEAASYLEERSWGDASSVQRVIGTVSLWGRVIECKCGWRASHAYPHAIYVPATRDRERLRVETGQAVALALTDYGVPSSASMRTRTARHRSSRPSAQEPRATETDRLKQPRRLSGLLGWAGSDTQRSALRYRIGLGARDLDCTLVLAEGEITRGFANSGGLVFVDQSTEKIAAA